MPDLYTDMLFDVGRSLILAAIAWFTYTVASRSVADWGRRATSWRATGWIAGLALFAAVSLGRPACEDEGDPLRGGCEVESDEGWKPTADQRSGRFLFWALMLGIPAGMGIATTRQRKSSLQ